MLRLGGNAVGNDRQLCELEQRLIEHWNIGGPEENTRKVELQTGEDDLDPDDESGQ
ncbi:hypothetical protein SAMN05216203_1415 [Marinobacter daqiaonensis]|uniref:Uncharacterized protein n=1 Tax=Marinobacter daqiaonensis TaxID=650891 RepID=A0A1I6HQK9_9GAMM|nr:hypothetical protein SAMN05216203_1415 [Marinobacter daqiaonensis]